MLKHELQRRFPAFAEWVENYLQTPQREMEAEGVTLARERRKEMRRLIETNPQRAWEHRISWRERQRLPAAIQEELETLVSGTGRLEVFAATPLPEQTNGFRPVARVATVGGQKYEAFVYGRRVNQPTRADVSLHGVAIDNVIALSDSPVRVLEADEAASPTKMLASAECPVSGIETAAVRAESGSRIYQLCSAEHVEQLGEMVWQQEAVAITSSASTGAQPALVLIVDFPNLPGGNTTVSNALEVMEQADLFYRSNSFGALSIGPVDITPVMRLSKESDHYLQQGQQGHSVLMAEAIGLARGLGYVAAEYRFVMVTFANIGFPWGGLGSVGASDAYVQGTTFRLRTVQHELGHNLGVWHAGAWLTADESVIGPGQRLESGNEFDIMGSGPGHMNGAFKAVLGWLPQTNIATAWTDGVYRIHALDLGGELALDTAYTLRVPAGPSLHGLPSDYWIEYRQQFAEHGVSSGALLHWATNTAGLDHSHLLDMNPAGVYGFRDAALLVGRTFVDNVRRICVTPVAKGATWLDIAVKLRPTNASIPTLTLTASALNVSPAQPVHFTATASDPDGDPLAYYWDFDDGTVLEASLNQPSATKTWTSPREYSVRCVVGDMKGGEASASVLVRVNNPDTYHAAGRVVSQDTPMTGVRVHNGLSGSDYRATFTDGDGQFVLTGLRADSYALGAAQSGSSFKPRFLNPVNLGPTNLDGLVFERRPAGALLVTGLDPLSGPVGSDVLILGENFHAVNSVRFGGVRATFASPEPGQLRARVPAGAVTAPISVSGAGWTDSSIVPFTVIETAPVITEHPQSQTNGYTLSAYFSAGASGSGPLGLQWRKDGMAIPGATNTNYIIINLQSEHAGVYDLVATNPAGSATSDPAQLTLESLPTFADVLDTPGLTWISGGTRPWSTQAAHTHDGIDAAASPVLSGGTGQSWLSTTYRPTNFAKMEFWARGSDIFGGALFVYDGGPGPPAQLLWSGGFGTNWSKGSLALGAGERRLHVVFRSGSTAPYQVWLDEVSFTSGSPPAIIEQPRDLAVVLGRPAVFSVRATGTPPLGYQWFRDWMPIAFAQQETYTIASVRPEDLGFTYYVTVNNEFGSTMSQGARISVASPPRVYIWFPHSNAEVAVGALEVRANTFGSLPIARVELFAGANKVAETTEAEPENPPNYRLVFTNNTPGQLSLWARVTDVEGLTGQSVPIQIFCFLSLVSRDAQWRYLDDGSQPDPDWRLLSFNDASWNSGSGLFGFGSQWESSEDEGPREYVNFGADQENKHVTTYFRRNFTGPAPAELSNVVMRVTHTGGMIVYLNNCEILRSGMPTGAVDHFTLATNDGRRIEVQKRLDPNWFVGGENQLAVEVHLASRAQESMLFNLRLLADLPPKPPEISITHPRSFGPASQPAFEMQAEPFDVDSDILNVQYFVNGLLFGEDSTAPYAIVISNLPPFGYATGLRTEMLDARVTDATSESGQATDVLIIAQGSPGYVDVVERGLLWHYHDRAADPGTAWRESTGREVVADWNLNLTPLAIAPGSEIGRHATTRFRRDFDASIPPGVGPDSRVYTNVVLYLLTELSDGAIVYFNGVEVFRYNLPAGAIPNDSYTGLPPSVFGYIRADIDAGLLKSTNNIVAVEMHQNQVDSEDFVFDLALIGMIEPTFPGIRLERSGDYLMLDWDWIYWYSIRFEKTDMLDGSGWEYASGYEPISIIPGGHQFFRFRWQPIFEPD